MTGLTTATATPAGQWGGSSWGASIDGGWEQPPAVDVAAHGDAPEGDGGDDTHPEFEVQDLGRDPGDAAAIVKASSASRVLFAALVDVLHPKLSFVTGLLVCRQLVEDYRWVCGCGCGCGCGCVCRRVSRVCVCVCLCV
jgi:hypothetical protein